MIKKVLMNLLFLCFLRYYFMIPEMISGKYGKTIEIPFIPSGFRTCLSQKGREMYGIQSIPVLIRKIMRHIGRERAILRKKPVPEYINVREMIIRFKKPVPHTMQKNKTPHLDSDAGSISHSVISRYIWIRCSISSRLLRPWRRSFSEGLRLQLLQGRA